VEKKQNLLHMQKKKGKKLKDPCPVCDEELYFNEDYSLRAGLLDSNKEVVGWMCPKCKSEFDFKNRVTYIMPMDNGRGVA
jgi:uncharacterized protein YlaI